MADPPTSNLDADTKKNLENRLSRCILRHQRFCRFFLVVASLRYEGCFFYGAGLPKLASEQDGTGEETEGRSPGKRKGFISFGNRYIIKNRMWQTANSDGGFRPKATKELIILLGHR